MTSHPASLFPSRLQPAHLRAAPGESISPDQVAELIRRACSIEAYRGCRLLLIVPDSTRTAPVDVMFRALHARLAPVVAQLDVIIALGTHPAMSDEAINQRVGITAAERATTYRHVRFFNHAWDDPKALHLLGTLQPDLVRDLSGDRFNEAVPVEINRRLLDYDEVMIIGPVFPHEVVGFSGGNKYLFPGVSGPQVLNFFHWLGALVTNPLIIGHKHTPVRRVVDHAASLLPVAKSCFCLTVDRKGGLAGLYAGTPESAWDLASDQSSELHIAWTDRAYHTVLSCAPKMYQDLWVGGKCMYKLEPIVADGGELIIYAPHIKEVSPIHGAHMMRIGYHCRDYFLGQWERFAHEPRGVLAHSTHVRGIGTYDIATGIEYPRVKVTLATQIPPEICAQINLGWRDWREIDPADYANREDEGIFYEPKAGERLYRVREAAK